VGGVTDEAVALLDGLETEVKHYRGDEARLPLGHWRLAVVN
jgi:hypothetical protein